MPDVNQVKKEIETRQLLRKARLDAVEDYIYFVSSKVGGLGLLGSGAFEILSPDIIHAVLPQPGGLMGMGFALLGGKQALKLLAKLLEVYGK